MPTVNQPPAPSAEEPFPLAMTADSAASHADESPMPSKANLPSPSQARRLVYEDAPRVDLISLLPDELSIKCMHYLTPRILSKSSMVSRRWRILSSDDSLWKPICQRRWATKKHIEHKLHPRVDYTSLLDSLTVKDMKEILRARKVDMKGITEKAEMKQLVKSTTPAESPRQANMRWSGKWKASFIIAEKDAGRIDITKEELCSMKWMFRLEFADWPPNHVVKAQFNRDYSYESDMAFQGDRKMSWRFYMKDVQVEQYPPLKVSRTKDWGFSLNNGYAEFHTVE
ncbi:hypothetical protein HDU67_006120 [Dinochytrium kinnereticum]|nr:hypothetical protein HDU67_006120 [Dinochytrium kinnereticum]